ncbi:MAG TPA: hypothetical protein VKA15_09690 [Isosphaeraceae bacterium]|nr:hypothetical protein [Isosphaeraceae bacterium]
MTRLASLRRSFPTFMRLASPFQWIGKSRRRLRAAALMLLAICAAPVLWWSAQLLGLPDIGEPFDAEAFRATTIPDDRNAFVLYRQAAGVLKLWNQYQRSSSNKKIDMFARWSKADPAVRRWAEENREALALYRQGAERPNAVDQVPVFRPGRSDTWDLWPTMHDFHVLAVLEGSRMEEQGDMAAAWGWYRAILRANRHIGMLGTVLKRRVIYRWDQELRDRLALWAADPRTTPALLRQALDDAVACESLAASESYMLRAEYLDMDRMLDDPKGPGAQMPPAWLISFASRPSVRPLMTYLTSWEMRSATDLWRAWRREPERSRRVLRLVIANWLAYFDLPPKDRPKLDLNATSSSYDFYSFGPEAPAKARVLSPEALGAWLDSTHDAHVLLRMLDLNKLRFTEWANRRDLLIMLGTQLYRRDHGTDPPTPEALVGPYLKSLPAEFPDDQRDETIPRAGNTAP